MQKKKKGTDSDSDSIRFIILERDIYSLTSSSVSGFSKYPKKNSNIRSNNLSSKISSISEKYIVAVKASFSELMKENLKKQEN